MNALTRDAKRNIQEIIHRALGEAKRLRSITLKAVPESVDRYSTLKEVAAYTILAERLTCMEQEWLTDEAHVYSLAIMGRVKKAKEAFELLDDAMCPIAVREDKNE